MPNTNIEQINWFKEFIDFGFAVFATALGVFLAFEIDRWRERSKSKARKLKLIQSLEVEIDSLLEYIRQNPNLRMYSDYQLQTDVIEETIKDQFEFFDQKTNKLLKQMRMELIMRDGELEEWTELNKSAIGTGKYPDVRADYNAGNIRANWTMFVMKISSMIIELKKELKREMLKS